jgi:hypothetical protein
MVKFVYNDYFFYKLVCLTHDVDLSYVGSTANWRNRKYKHNTIWNNPNNKEYNIKKYQIIRENGGFENFKMVQIDFREHLTQREAEAVEEEYRVELRANMNGKKCSAGCETRQEYESKYRQDHKWEKAEYDTKYRQNHRQELTEYQAKYRQDHQEEIKQKQNVKHECEVCGGKYTQSNKACHIKSKKHETAQSNTPSTSTE